MHRRANGVKAQKKRESTSASYRSPTILTGLDKVTDELAGTVLSSRPERRTVPRRLRARDGESGTAAYKCLCGWVQRALPGLQGPRAAPGPGNQLLVNSERYVAARSASVPSASSGQLHWALHNLPTVADDADPVPPRRGLEHGDAATTSRRASPRAAPSMPATRPAAFAAPGRRNVTGVHRGVQLLESKPTVPTKGHRCGLPASACRRRLITLRHDHAAKLPPPTPPAQTWRPIAPPATALMPRWAAKERRAATTSCGQLKAAAGMTMFPVPAHRPLPTTATSTRPRASRIRRRRTTGRDSSRRLRRESSSRPPFCTWAVGTRSAGRR